MHYLGADTLVLNSGIQKKLCEKKLTICCRALQPADISAFNNNRNPVDEPDETLSVLSSYCLSCARDLECQTEILPCFLAVVFPVSISAPCEHGATPVKPRRPRGPISE